MNGLSSEILFEKFQIIEVLKKDEHAAVFLADHIYLSKKIILKVLNTQKLSDPTLVERFKREAKILAKLDSPNIIKVLDFGMFKEFFYISFEYIEGLSLRNLLKQSQLSFEQKNHLMTQLLKGLFYAHQNQIIHRDIKPENIFVDNNLNLKIGDFGLALSAEDNFVTNPYSIVGTPSYMSPEQVRGAKLTPQSDLFSAGVVLYELFVGNNPFLKENVSLTLNEIMAFGETEIGNGLKDQPQEIKDVLYHLLRKNPKDRYVTAQEALNDLGVSIDQPTVVIPFDERHKQKHKLRGIAAVVTVAVLIVAWMLLKLFDNLSPNTNSNPNLSFNNQQKQEVVPKDSAVRKNVADGEQVNLNNLNKPLIESQNPQTKDQNSINQPGNQLVNNQDVKKEENKPIIFGRLDLQCTDGTSITIDGDFLDTAPLNKLVRLQDGLHTLKLTNPNYPPYDTTFTIKENETTKLRINLNSQVGFLVIDSRPFAEVFINSKSRGETPLKAIKLNPDVYTITLKHPDYKDIDTVVTVQKGSIINLKFRLPKK